MGTFRVETFLSTIKGCFFWIYSLIFLFSTFPFSLTLLILLLLFLLPLGLSLKKDSQLPDISVPSGETLLITGHV